MNNFNRRLALILAIAFGVSSCSKTGTLTPLATVPREEFIDVHVSFCTSAPIASRQKIKYIFILDHSQSNQVGFALSNGDVTGTDPTGSRRYGPLLDFVTNLANDPNNTTTFNLINFNNNIFQPNGLDLKSIKTGRDDFADIVTRDWVGNGSNLAPAPYDAGFTNYLAALEAAKLLIKNDAVDESRNPIKPIVKTTYKVIFVSDGVPTIATAPGDPFPTYTQQFAADIQPVIASTLDIKDIPALTPFISGITFDTVYYFQNNEVAGAETLLQQMADVGNGQFQKYGLGESILYQIFAPPLRNFKNILTDIFVENKNTVWWDDGRFLPSSQGDGMPDVIKSQFNANPARKDSDNNGVSDMVEYRSKGKPCNSGSCEVSGHDPYSVCDGYDRLSLADGSVTFRSSGNDGFNDCEAFVLGANQNSFNSNGDLIPDFIKFKYQVPYVSGIKGSFLTPYNDGMNHYMKMKLGLPTSIAVNKVPAEYKKQIQELKRVESPDPSLDCYQLDVKNFATLRASDVVKVSIIQNAAIVEDKPFLKTAEKPLSEGSSITFVAEDFK